MMRIGLDEWSVHHMDTPAYDKLDLVERHGLEGIQFADALSLSKTLDHGELREIAAEAKRRGLYLEMGIPGLNILRPSPKALQAGQGDFMNGQRKLLEAAAATGAKVIRTFAGGPGDRLRRGTEWQAQMQGSVILAKHLAPLARELGVILAFETHADVTSFELLRILEQIGEDDVAKVCLDTGNFPIVLEDPLAATRRLAPHVIATHFKDCITELSESGITVNCRPVGTGILPAAEILAVLKPLHPDLTLSIEDHEGVFHLDIFKDGWQRSYPDAAPDEIDWLVAQAGKSKERIASGEIPLTEQLEQIPWADQADERICIGTANLKRILQEATI
ncbi:sugar phosphate isomerase/epimerase family protein [Paenibacillus thalictri]|uniref:Sugar phosphate isomerase/epimerase n=1 Tax=Paenibacillus thalictri TaxID=2527873 RepID=A0A4Q9DSL6_9BACL|nr:sugar phosphate isomerase/epimerase family protein [Paenibacillus thalictri]TBL79076.1 sugar phosphate isomerase/epimerase [Paenibacillus thalictri]